MKRAVALQPLSHQHHNSLMACLLISKGISKKANPDIISDFITRLYRDDLKPHFEIEEKVLFPVLDSDHLRRMLEREHTTLAILSGRIAHEHDYAVMNTFYKLLEQHIRFEERVVFNHVQEVVSNEQINLIREKLAHLHATKCSDYPNKFWE